MRLFLDSSDIHQWSDAARANLLYGVTTNPLIFKREGLQYSIQNITRLIDTARDLNLRELQIRNRGLRPRSRHSRVHALI